MVGEHIASRSLSLTDFHRSLERASAIVARRAGYRWPRVCFPEMARRLVYARDITHPSLGGTAPVHLIVSEVYDALIEAGASEAKAKAAAGAIPVGEHLATKADIAELASQIAELKTELAVLKMGVFTIGPATLALLVKLVFFP